jgi:hypothetical protein
VSSPPSRVVHCADALDWLASAPPLEGCSFFTSLPDASELAGMSHAAWRAWFVEAAALVLRRTPADGVALFFQSDVRHAGAWVDKAYLVQRAAEEASATLLFHKIVCRKTAGTITFGRAAYSHLLAFSRGTAPAPAVPIPDVLPDGGEMTWVRAIGLEACRAGCRFIRAHTQSRTVVDPFCGVGTVLAVANETGLDAIGVELNRKRARKARTLTVGA